LSRWHKSSAAPSPSFLPLAAIQAEIQSRLTDEEREAERAAAEARLDDSRDRSKSLAGFVRECWHVLEPARPYVHGWIVDAICAHLEAITWGKFLALGLENRLLFNVPPGMMKSLLVSVIWPAWEWGPAGMPHLQYLSTSYSEHYAKRDCRKMRDLVQSEWYQARWPLTLTRTGETSIANDRGGWREAMPFTSLTGGRGDRVIFDDPHSTEMAESEADRVKTTRVFRESMTSRLNDPVTSAIVGIMQRLHEEDISGVILKYGMPYIHVMFPMEFDPKRRCVTPIFTDPRTYEDELLFPERFPRAVVDRDKETMLEYAVAGQWQQKPGPRGGGLFKRDWFEVVPAFPAGTRWCRGWDLAGSKGKKSPYTVGMKLGVCRGVYYVGQVYREKASPEDVTKAITNTASQDGHGVEIDIPQDPGQAGKSQVHYLVQQLAGYVVHFSPETGSKRDRAKPVASQAKIGNIKLVDGPYVPRFLDEVEVFPNSIYLDQVDAMSRAFARLLIMVAQGDDDSISAPEEVTA